MTYSYKEFSRDLELILNKSKGIDYDVISEWAFRVRDENCRDINQEVKGWICSFELMSMDPQFEYSESELREYIHKAIEKSGSPFGVSCN